MNNINRYASEVREDLRRVRPLTPRKSFQVAKMWGAHHEIVRLKTLDPKISNVDIAKILGVSIVMVSYTLNSRIVKDKLALMVGARDAETIDIAQRIMKFGPKCLELLENVISGTGEAKDAPIGLRARYADKHLERMGHGAIKKVQSATMHLTPADIDEIKERAKRSGVINVTPTQAVS